MDVPSTLHPTFAIPIGLQEYVKFWLSAYCWSTTSSIALATIGSETVSSLKLGVEFDKVIIGSSLILSTSTENSSSKEPPSASVIVNLKFCCP